MPISPILILHICGASVGLLSGTVAMSFRKGSRRHGLAGRVFAISMLCMSSTGAYIGFTKSQPTNVLMGCLTFYLVATAWSIAKRPDVKTGPFDWGALLLALTVGAGLVIVGWQAAKTPTGSKDGIPAAICFFWGAVALLFAAGDIRMLVRGGVLGAQRIARHLWRMSFAYLIAVMSFFLGKQNLFPAGLRGSKVFFAPPIFVLFLMTFWLVRVSFTKAYKSKSMPRRAAVHPLPT